MILDHVEAIRHVLKFEGGYVNDPDDPGGETNFGISKRSYPDLDIAGLTEDDAIEIYRHNYWAWLGCDALLPAIIRLPLLDAAVNQGPARAAGFLQAAVGAKVDGIIGPMTRAAVRRATPKRLVESFTVERIAHYARLASKRKTSRKFLLGWIRRALKVRALALDIK